MPFQVMLEAQLRAASIEPKIAPFQEFSKTAQHRSMGLYLLWHLRVVDEPYLPLRFSGKATILLINWLRLLRVAAPGV